MTEDIKIDPDFEKYSMLIMSRVDDLIKGSKVSYPAMREFKRVPDKQRNKNNHIHKGSMNIYENDSVAKLKQAWWLHKDFKVTSEERLIIETDMLEDRHPIDDYLYYDEDHKAYLFGHDVIEKRIYHETQTVFIKMAIDDAHSRLMNFKESLPYGRDKRNAKIESKINELEIADHATNYPAYWHIKFTGRIICSLITSPGSKLLSPHYYHEDYKAIKKTYSDIIYLDKLNEFLSKEERIEYTLEDWLKVSDEISQNIVEKCLSAHEYNNLCDFDKCSMIKGSVVCYGQPNSIHIIRSKEYARIKAKRKDMFQDEAKEFSELLYKYFIRESEIHPDPSAYLTDILDTITRSISKNETEPVLFNVPLEDNCEYKSIGDSELLEKLSHRYAHNPYYKVYREYRLKSSEDFKFVTPRTDNLFRSLEVRVYGISLLRDRLVEYLDQGIDTKIKKHSYNTLVDNFVSVSEYNKVMELCVEAKFLAPGTYVWNDEGGRHKSLAVGLIKVLHAKNYLKMKLINQHIVFIINNEFKLDVGIDTAKKTKASSFPDVTFDFIEIYTKPTS